MSPGAATTGAAPASRTTLHVAGLILARVAAGVASAAIGLVVPRALGVADSAHYGIAVGVALMLVVLTDLGLTTSMSRALAEERADATVLGKVLALRLAVAALAGLAMVAVGLLLSAGVALPGLDTGGNMPRYLALAGALVVTASVSGVAFGLLPTLGRVRALLVVTIAQPALELALVLGVVSAGLGAPVIIVASTAATGFVGVVALGIAVRAVRQRTPAPDVDAATVRSVRAYGGPMFLVAVSFALFGQVDQLVVYVLRGAEEAAAYIWSWRLVTLLHMPGLAVATIVAPRLARRAALSGIDAYHDEQLRRQAFLRWLAVLAAAYAGIAAICAALSTWLVPVALGDKYADAGPVFAALCWYAFLLGVAPLVTMAANFLGGAGVRVKLGAVTLAVNVVLDLLLVPWLGVYGAAIGTSVAFTWYVAAHARLSLSLLASEGPPARRSADPGAAGVVPRRRVAAAVAAVVACAAAAAAAARGVAMLVDAGAPDVAALLAGGFAGVATFAAGAALSMRIAGVGPRAIVAVDVAPVPPLQSPGAAAAGGDLAARMPDTEPDRGAA